MTSPGLDDGGMGQDVFAEVATILFGDGASELISKANPDGMDLSAGKKQKKRERRQAQVGYASNLVGIAAGVAGTGAALRDDRFKEGGKASQFIYRKAKKIPNPISGKGGKAGAILAGGALGLQVGNIAGDAVANRVLSRAKKKDIHKSKGGALIAVGTVGGATGVGAATGYENRKNKKRGSLKKQAFVVAGNKVEPKIKGKLKKLSKDETMVEKSVVQVSKMDSDKMQVFGWASVVEKNGEPIYDLQGDFIPVDEMETSAYTFVRKSRKAGDMHRRDGENPFVVGELIESIAVTPEKKTALGLPDSAPTGWWVGLQIEDPVVWSDIKSGKRTGFSVHGTGRRTPIDA